jgi:uncharacterized protein
MIHIGILSDTHLSSCPDFFRAQAQRAFGGCDIILHAGDLTDMAVLDTFGGKIVYAVHGNMCNPASRQLLPNRRLITIGGHRIGIFHGAWGPRHTVEERAWAMFPKADCIVYGHTHQAVCHRIGSILFINPGSFLGTGLFGAPGTYAILDIDEQAEKPDGLRAAIHQLPPQP